MAAPVAAAASAPPLGQRPLVAPVAAPAPIVQPAGGLAQTAAPQAPAESKRTLRKLSAEEKAQRRLRQNLIMAGFGLAVLLLALAILLRFSG